MIFLERAQKTISRNIKSAEEKLRCIQADPIAKPPEQLRINPDFDPHILEGKTPLAASQICKSFGTHHLLKNVDLTIQVADRIVLVGPNGVGKSTLLKILSRITEPSAGKVTINGRVSSLLEVGTGFHPELTGRENIFLSGAILGMKRAEIKKKFDEMTAR